MDEEETDEFELPDLGAGTAEPKKESFLPFLGAIGLISVVAIGAGWIVSGQIGGTGAPSSVQSSQVTKDAASNKTDKDGDTSGDEVSNTNTKVVKLEPVIVSMKNSSNAFLRLELGLVVDKEARFDDETSKLRIGSEIAAFTQTLSIKQISGPSGYLHLREDLLDRARLATNGEVKDLLILTMVAE